MLFTCLERFPIVLATLLSGIGMVGGFTLAYLSQDSLAFAFGVSHTIFGSLLFLLFMSLLGIEVGVRIILEPLVTGRPPLGPSYHRLWGRYVVSPLRRLMYYFLPQSEPAELIDLE